MSFLSELVGAVVTATATVLYVAAKTTLEIIDAASEAWIKFREQRRREGFTETDILKEKVLDELKVVNDELLAILDKYHRRGGISAGEKRQVEHLRQCRDELKQSLDELDELAAAREIGNEPNAFEKFTLDNDSAHIIQGQVGVSMFGKKCPECGRDMLIQWPRAVKAAGINDLFWGCSGYYIKLPNGQQACKNTVLMTQYDMSIFARTDSPESKVSNDELTGLVLLPGPSNIVNERLNDVISDQRSQHRGSNDYRCPTHGEELVLRKKNQATSLLDQYFLGCQRWKPNNQGCSYLVKLKSAMQLATLLKKETGTGIL